MLLQGAAMRATKFLVYNKITACVKQICVLELYVEFRIEKHCLMKMFASLETFVINIY